MVNSFKSQILDTLVGFLKEDKWFIKVEADSIMATVLVSKTYPEVNLQIIAREKGYDVIISTDFVVDESSRASVMEFFTRVNYNLANGFFQFDIDIGIYRFMSSNSLSDGMPDKSTFITSIIMPIVFFCKYNDWIGKVVSHELTAQEAVDKADEKSQTMFLEKK